MGINEWHIACREDSSGKRKESIPNPTPLFFLTFLFWKDYRVMGNHKMKYTGTYPVTSPGSHSISGVTVEYNITTRTLTLVQSCTSSVLITCIRVCVCRSVQPYPIEALCKHHHEMEGDSSTISLPLTLCSHTHTHPPAQNPGNHWSSL